MEKLPDYDKAGHCVKCHKHLLMEQVIGLKNVIRFSPQYTTMQFKMNDGSNMRVAMCKPCAETITDDDREAIMESVYKGWKVEVGQIAGWEEDKKERYLNKQKNLTILDRSDKPLPKGRNKPKKVKEKEIKDGNNI